MRSLSPQARSLLPGAILAPGLFALIAEPAIWLVRTWADPSYASDGAWVAAGVGALLLRSLSSGATDPDPRARRWALRLFFATAAIRLVGRLLAVKTVGALALVVDVAALALLLGVANRPWALSPWALAGLSSLALPIEHLAQRLLAHPLQLVAAASAELVLQPIFPLLERQGTLLWHPAAPLAIDLPCSGARGLVLLTGIALALACRRRCSVGRFGLALSAVLGGALLANSLRIVALFLGTVAGLTVLDEPWHSALGTIALAIGTLPLLFVARAAPLRVALQSVAPSRGALQSSAPLRVGSRSHAPGWIRRRSRRSTWAPATLLSAVGLVAAFAPETPLDASVAGLGRPLPTRAGAFLSEPAALLEQERHYYARYGGGAQKRIYDDGAGPLHTALLVHTSAPLRHLHGPDRCLLGAGHRVTRLGVRTGRVPTTLYRSVAPDGSAWRVEASFFADDGSAAAGVSEVLWRWIERPEVAWNLVERISAWEVCEVDPTRCARLDAALFAALDLPSDSIQPEGRSHEDPSI